MDNSWLIKINNLSILIDPWFTGAEIDYFKWFNMQWHRHTPIALEEVPHYDWIIITQKFPDHFHAETLSKLNPKNVIAPLSIRKKIQELLPAANIIFVQNDNPSIQLEEATIQWFNSNKKIDPRFDAMAIHNNEESIFVATHGFEFSKEQKNIKDKIENELEKHAETENIIRTAGLDYDTEPDYSKSSTAELIMRTMYLSDLLVVDKNTKQGDFKDPVSKKGVAQKLSAIKKALTDRGFDKEELENLGLGN
jgi:hypothetical protein